MVNLTRRLLWLIVPISLGLTAVIVLLAGMPARPAQAAAPQLAPAGCDNDLAEPNNSYTEATALSVPGVLYRRYICDYPVAQELDWYSITLGAGQHVAIFAHFTDVTNTQDLDLYMFDTTGQILIASSNGTISNEAISYTAPSAGVYYIEVDGYLNAQNIYDLSISGGCYARASSDFASVDAKAVRDAVAQAASGGTVKVAGYCPGTVTEFGDVQTARISKTLTLAGGYAPGSWTTPLPLTQPTTLDAMNSGRVISATGSLTLTGLTLQHGTSGPNNGGGLYFQGFLVLSGTTFYSNTAGFGGGGGSVIGYAAITNSIFNENVALGDRGGGLSVLGATIAGGSFTGNRAANDGGGLYVSNSLSLDGTEFTDNASQRYGGGAYTGSAAGNSVANAFFSGNEALVAGGLYAGGPLDLVSSAFSSNKAENGGGLASVSAVVISNSIFTANFAQTGGGAVNTNGPLTLDHVTFNNNGASTGSGGGVLSYNTIQVTSTTFINNSAREDGGGLYLSELDQTGASSATPAGPPFAPGRFANVVFADNSAHLGTDLAFVAPAAYSLLHATFWSGSHAVTESILVFNANLTMRNNLFTGYPTAVRRNSGVVDEDYNLYFGGGASVASYLTGTVTSGGHSLVADPLLVDGPDSDFHLTYASPARDHGLNQGVPDDFDGDPRPYGYGVDIGFDEMVGYPLIVHLPAVLR